MNIAEERWLRLADLFLALIVGVAWSLSAGAIGWSPLLIMALPWIIRLSLARSPFFSTSSDFFMLVFLMTAAIGVWASYDRSVAWGKFWVMAGAILIYYALARQVQEDVWLSAGALAVVGAVIAGYFLLTHDWQAWPADIKILTRIGLRWMVIRPEFSAPRLHPNIAGGIMASLAPFSIAFGRFAWRRQRVGLFGLAVVAGILILAGLLLTSSRAAWLALVSAAGIWALWWLSRPLSAVLRLKRTTLFVLMLVATIGLGLAASYTFSGGPATVIAGLPGPNRAMSRMELARDDWNLIGDFPLTGGGLASFAGLYSQYIAVIPFFLFDYGHNLYLDVALEQGAIGALSMIAILSAATWQLAQSIFGQSRNPSPGHGQAGQPKLDGIDLFRWATLVAVVTMGLHGLVDDAFYGGRGTPFLFILPGMAVAVSGRQSLLPGRFSRNKARLVILAAVSIMVLGITLGFGRTLRATWYANLGAVQMARVELAGWPTGEWDDGSQVNRLAPAADRFERSLQLNPRNRTAHHRLGLIALLQQDFNLAVAHLEEAHALDREHRGILKFLGYSYVWAGDLAKAADALAYIPEARDEMDVYSRWWRTQGRLDLAAQAEQMVSYLDEGIVITQP